MLNKINTQRHYHLKKDLQQSIHQVKNTHLDCIKNNKINNHNQMKAVKFTTIKAKKL